MAKIIVQEQIDKIIKYLQPLLPLANFHMVDYFSVNVFEKFFPDSLEKELKNINPGIAINKIFTKDLETLPNLKSYMDETSEFILKNCPDVCMSLTDFENKLKDLNSEEILRLKLNVFMNSKKSHEVDIMSYICAAIKSISKTSHLIDVGDGKGYLSSMLALHHKIPVLGVDCIKINTDGAVKRVQKLSKVWNGLTSNQRTSKETTAHLYKQITMFVDETINFTELISKVFLEKPETLGIVGLHTCGDLASNCLRIFTKNSDIRTICNVGCCYHLLNESLTDAKGFPMSQYLHNKKFELGRSARMIATQSFERILSNKESPNKKLFYRALFEVLLDLEQCSLPKGDRQVGRFKKEICDFIEYVHKASSRINVKVNKTDTELRKFYEDFKDKENELNLFYLLRGMLSSAIESLILLDRLLYLLENGLDNSFLVHLFDPMISPRCYAVISLK